MAEIPTPLSPWKRLVHVCDQCEQPWGQHLKLARRRWHEHNPDALDDPALDVIEDWVHLGDCILLLKLANQGPPGPVGPQGETTVVTDDEVWCHEENCQYRHWTSGEMPTHRRGDGCPPSTYRTKETE
ncbi:hypothetical protein SEA_PUPPER_223 [Gordonia phage Pupper]|uniref:Uncharacterized protein n=1 Tax=Gordonia phage Pupper TaxID=2571249 RepID=A0A4Y6ESF9_9CAUD|nr:hypothetical protein KHQ83_gp054 [Gordonia phage Pupper]QDF18709.1 hypothetical protein SEA_PUPPER_223 [Gordonia phage Pupper]